MSAASGDLRERLADLLTQGCDERIVVDPKTGMHKYNGTNQPVPGSVCRSSCTFSIPTEEMFVEGMAELARLEEDASEAENLRQNICDRLFSAWKLENGTALNLFPSGTDAEFVPMLLGLGRALKAGGKMASIITCATEVGSGTNNAATGKHFADLLPAPHLCPSHKVGASLFTDEAGMPSIDAITLKLRTNDGKRRAIEDLDVATQEAVTHALGDGGYEVVVVHMVVGSKTGHCMPSKDAMHKLVSQYGTRVVPVVDACQTRMLDTGLRDLLNCGFAVLATGSKFYGGPPFCGAAMLPKAMAEELDAALASNVGGFADAVRSSSLGAYISRSLVSPELPTLKALLPEDVPNLGLLLRWQMALYNIEEFHAISELDRDTVAATWTSQTIQMVRGKATPAISVVEDRSTVTSVLKVAARPRVRSRRQSSAVDRFGARTCVVLERRSCSPVARLEAKMLPATTIILLELKKPVSNTDEQEPTWERLGLAELKKVHTLMASELSGISGLSEEEAEVMGQRFFMAQPVSLGPDYHIIRVAIGAPLLVRMHTAEGDQMKGELEEVAREDKMLFEKLDLVLRTWDACCV